MSEHRWGEPDKDGVRACAKAGCTVRVADSFRRWQRKPGAHWRDQLRELIPACTGTDAPEATPSPLEVVRKALHDVRCGRTGNAGDRHILADNAIAALATLEESIRADEREACASVAERQRAYREMIFARTVTPDARLAHQSAIDASSVISRNIRARGKR